MNLIPANATHVGSRSEQQDALGFSDIDEQSFVTHGGVLAVVADGMGGLENGATASKLAVQTMIDSYRVKTPEESISYALVRSIKAANEAVFELAWTTDGIGNVGTTLVAAVIHNESLYWISAGDSRLYLVRGAELAQLSADHTLEHQLLRRMIKGEINYDDVQRDPERDSVTSYLGTQEPPDFDRNLRPFPVAKGDRLILCSDGLYNILSSEEILTNSGSFEVNEAADALIRETIAKNHPQQDNVTVAMLALEANRVRVPATKRTTARKSRQKIVRRLYLSAGLATVLGLAGIGAFMTFNGKEVSSPITIEKKVSAEPSTDNKLEDVSGSRAETGTDSDVKEKTTIDARQTEENQDPEQAPPPNKPAMETNQADQDRPEVKKRNGLDTET